MVGQQQCLLCKTTLKNVWNSPCLPQAKCVIIHWPSNLALNNRLHLFSNQDYWGKLVNDNWFKRSLVKAPSTRKSISINFKFSKDCLFWRQHRKTKQIVQKLFTEHFSYSTSTPTRSTEAFTLLSQSFAQKPTKQEGRLSWSMNS